MQSAMYKLALISLLMLSACSGRRGSLTGAGANHSSSEGATEDLGSPSDDPPVAEEEDHWDREEILRLHQDVEFSAGALDIAADEAGSENIIEAHFSWGDRSDDDRLKDPPLAWRPLASGGYLVLAGPAGFWFESLTVMLEIRPKNGELQPVSVAMWICTDYAMPTFVGPLTGTVTLDASSSSAAGLLRLDYDLGSRLGQMKHSANGRLSIPLTPSGQPLSPKQAEALEVLDRYARSARLDD